MDEVVQIVQLQKKMEVDNQLELQKIEVQDVEMEMEIVVQIVQRIDSPVLVSRVVRVVVVVPNERYPVESLELSLESLDLSLEVIGLDILEVIGFDILEVKLGWVVSLQLSLQLERLDLQLERLDLQLDLQLSLQLVFGHLASFDILEMIENVLSTYSIHL